MYKYLLWDIDGTILDFVASERCAIKELFKRFELGECTDEMLQIYSKINVKYWDALARNELTKPEVLIGRFNEFFTLMNIDTGVAEDFNKAYQLALGDYCIFVKDAKEILLSQKGKYTIAAVTNGTKIAQTKKLRTSGLDKIFDSIFISEDVGFEKPNLGFFQCVFEALNIKDKSEVLIIGDSLASDIQGGINAEIDTCWYNPKHTENKSNLKITYEIDDLKKIQRILVQ
ncbi:MAG: YjjG family noncanonical pyrimidine nucleotidase [Ruminococcus sp.]